MEKIDILMATYNGEKYLSEQIESILSQTYSEFNLIISDDCSKDSTRKILEEYEKKDKRIKVYFQENNLGYVKNFEFLLSKVENEYYMLSDQDDVWLPEKVEKSINFLEKEKADLVFSDLTVVDKDLNTMFDSFNTLMKYEKKAKKYTDYRLNYLYNCVTGCTMLSKKEFLDNILPLPINSKYVIHDFWIPLTVSIIGKVKYLDEPLIKYRQHDANQVGAKTKGNGFTKFEDMRSKFINIKIEIFDTYVKNDRIFTEEMKKINQKALEYFKSLKQRKYFNFKGLTIFNKLYKNDNLYFYLSNFLIFNMPFLAKILFYIRLKLKGFKNGK